jgi:hypothetical protein
MQIIVCMTILNAMWEQAVGRLQQAERVHAEPACEAFDAAQRQVVLAALEAADVGVVDAQQLGEGLLAEAALVPVRTKVARDGPLKLAFHRTEPFRSAGYRSTEL